MKSKASGTYSWWQFYSGLYNPHSLREPSSSIGIESKHQMGHWMVESFLTPAIQFAQLLWFASFLGDILLGGLAGGFMSSTWLILWSIACHGSSPFNNSKGHISLFCGLGYFGSLKQKIALQELLWLYSGVIVVSYSLLIDSHYDLYVSS